MHDADENFGMRVEISREEVLLDTGGGLKKAAWFFLKGDERFLLHNVDVISNIDLQRMVEFHRDSDALATLAVQDRQSSRRLLFDDESWLCGRQGEGEEAEIVGGGRRYRPLAFCGIHVISRRIFSLLKEAGAFPLVPAYLRLAGEGQKVVAFRADEYDWRDLGTVESLAGAGGEVFGKGRKADPLSG